MHISTLPNPSHLEISTPIAVGKARARAQTLNLGDYNLSNEESMIGDGVL